jgi:hypothetical protein
LLSKHGGRDNDVIAIINLYKIYFDLSYRFNIPWEIKRLEEMIKEGQQMFGGYGLLFEKQVEEFVNNILPIINKIIDNIIELITPQKRLLD